MLPALLTAAVAPSRAMALTMENGARITYATILKNLGFALVPLILALTTLWAAWWYVVIHPQPDALSHPPRSPSGFSPATPAPPHLKKKNWRSSAPPSPARRKRVNRKCCSRWAMPICKTVRRMRRSMPGRRRNSTPTSPSPAAIIALMLFYYYWTMGAAQFEVLRLLTSSVMPLGILTAIVLAVILLGITTATESAAVGAAGAFLLAFQARTLDWKRTKEAVFLTAKTTSMVCWLFVGSALFSAVFAILGGQALLESWVLSLNLTPVQFMILSQAIIFILGWPLEWTEIIVIFVPIFLPMLKHFGIDPILWGVLVFVNLQAAFLSPPVAMSAFYLKGVAPSHVTLNQIFSGMMPYMLIVIICMVLMYIWPGLTLWLPNYLYGN
jgi:TRAP-type mannitol/chloroaromatic compound transport system permease large subunit